VKMVWVQEGNFRGDVPLWTLKLVLSRPSEFIKALPKCFRGYSISIRGEKRRKLGGRKF